MASFMAVLFRSEETPSPVVFRCVESPAVRRAGDALERFRDAFQRVAGAGPVEPFPDLLGVFRGKLEPQEPPPQLLGHRQGRAAPGKRVQHQVPFVAARLDDPAQEPLGHLAAVPAGPLGERPADPGEVPGVFVRAEAFGQVLGAENPGGAGGWGWGPGAARVQGSGFRVQGARYRGWGLGARGLGRIVIRLPRTPVLAPSP